MIDVHTHLLPGVDDGSPSAEVSLPVLERFANDGVQIVVCTPHLEASRAAYAPYERHMEILTALRARAFVSPELRLGWEIMLDAPGIDLRDTRLSLGGSTAVLVEFPRMMTPPNAAEELFRLRMTGVVPVLAHPERYWGCTTALVEEWRRVGTAIQMDVAGMFASGPQGSLAMSLLERGLVDLLASDTHGDRRALLPARQWLLELGAEDTADLLTRRNAAHLLADRPLEPVAPIERRRGMFGRLKELLLGRA
jgi:protein-tyrosine phosphatase